MASTTLDELIKKGALKLDDPLDKVLTELGRLAPHEFSQISGAADLQAKVVKMQSLMSNVLESKEKLDMMMKTMSQQQKALEGQKDLGERLQKFSEDQKKLQEQLRSMKGRNEELEKEKGELIEKCDTLSKQAALSRSSEREEQLEHKLSESNETIKMLKQMVASMEEDKKGLEAAMRMNKDQLLIMRSERDALKNEREVWKGKSKKLALSMQEIMKVQKEEAEKQNRAIEDIRKDNQSINDALKQSKNQIAVVLIEKESIKSEFDALSKFKDVLNEQVETLQNKCASMQELEKKVEELSIQRKTFENEKKKLTNVILEMKQKMTEKHRMSLELIQSLKQNNEEILNQMDNAKKSLEWKNSEISRIEQELKLLKEQSANYIQELIAKHLKEKELLNVELDKQTQVFIKMKSSISEVVKTHKELSQKYIEELSSLEDQSNLELEKLKAKHRIEQNQTEEKLKRQSLAMVNLKSSIKEAMERQRMESEKYIDEINSLQKQSDDKVGKLIYNHKFEKRMLEEKLMKQSQALLAVKNLIKESMEKQRVDSEKYIKDVEALKKQSDDNLEKLIASNNLEKQRLKEKLNMQKEALIYMKSLINESIERQTIEAEKHFKDIELLKLQSNESLEKLTAAHILERQCFEGKLRKQNKALVAIRRHVRETLEKELLKVQNEAAEGISKANQELLTQLSISNEQLRTTNNKLNAEQTDLNKAKAALLELSGILRESKVIMDDLTRGSMKKHAELAQALQDLTMQLIGAKADRQHLAAILKGALEKQKAQSSSLQVIASGLKSTNQDLMYELSNTRSMLRETSGHLMKRVEQLERVKAGVQKLIKESRANQREQKNRLEEALNAERVQLNVQRKQMMISMRKLIEYQKNQFETQKNELDNLHKVNEELLSNLQAVKSQLNASLEGLGRKDVQLKKAKELSLNGFTKFKEQLEWEVREHEKITQKYQTLLEDKQNLNQHYSKCRKVLFKSVKIIKSMDFYSKQQAELASHQQELLKQASIAEIDKLITVSKNQNTLIDNLSNELAEVKWGQECKEKENARLITASKEMASTFQAAFSEQKVHITEIEDNQAQLLCVFQDTREKLSEATSQLSMKTILLEKTNQLTGALVERVKRHQGEQIVRHEKLFSDYKALFDERIGLRNHILKYERALEKIHMSFRMLRARNPPSSAALERQQILIYDLNLQRLSNLQTLLEKAQRQNTKQRTVIARLNRDFILLQSHAQRAIQAQKESFNSYHSSTVSQISALMQKNIQMANSLEEEQELVMRQEAFFKSKISAQEVSFGYQLRKMSGKTKQYSGMCAQMIAFLNNKFDDLRLLVKPMSTMTLAVMHRHQQLRNQLDLANSQLEQARIDFEATKELVAYKYGLETWRENEALKRECRELREILVEKEVELINLLQLCHIRLEEDKKLILPKYLVQKERELMQKLVEKNKADLFRIQP